MLFHDVYKILFAINFRIKSLPVLNDTDLWFMKGSQSHNFESRILSFWIYKRYYFEPLPHDFKGPF